MSNFEASGQGDSDVFPNFTRGDDVLSYMHCVFYGHPSLEAVVRALPSDAQLESGIEKSVPSFNFRDSWSSRRTRKRKREEGTDALAAAISSLASSQQSEQPIVLQTQGVPVS